MCKLKKILKTTVITLIIFIILFFIGFYTLIYLTFSPIEEVPFEANSWKNGTNRAQMLFPRQNMVDKLIENNILLGKTEKEILALLGEPDSRFNENYEKKYFSYFIGPARRLASADDEWLGIYFNSNGTVSETKLTVH